MQDLHETYLAQYEIAFRDGNASGVMCSYDGLNGRPSCAHSYILNDVMRRAWSRPDALYAITIQTITVWAITVWAITALCVVQTRRATCHNYVGHNCIGHNCAVRGPDPTRSW